MAVAGPGCSGWQYRAVINCVVLQFNNNISVSARRGLTQQEILFTIFMGKSCCWDFSNKEKCVAQFSRLVCSAGNTRRVASAGLRLHQPPVKTTNKQDLFISEWNLWFIDCCDFYFRIKVSTLDWVWELSYAKLSCRLEVLAVWSEGQSQVGWSHQATHSGSSG